MIILRSRLFSSKKKKSEKENDNKRKNAAILGAGGAAALGSTKVYKGLNKIFYHAAKKGMDTTISDSHEVNEKLKAKAKDMGINVVSDSGFKNSAYLGGIPGADKMDKEKRTNIGRDQGLRDSAEHFGTDTIAMGLGDGNPAVLAHEMGHAAMSKKGRSKDILGKAAHSKAGRYAAIPYHISSGTYEEMIDDPNLKKSFKRIRQGVNGTFLISGVRHGIKAAKKEEEGDNKGAKKELRKGLIRSSLIMAPIPITEAAASRKGLKYLKEVGASKETIKNARKTLGSAFGTYASIASRPILLDVGGTALGYGAYKLSHKKKSEKNKKEKKDDNNT